MTELFALEAPEMPRAPVLICAIDSWVDAGLAAARTRAAITDSCDLRVIGRFDAEALVDHQARRPLLHLVDGVNSAIDWPEILLQLGADRDGRQFLLLSGPEPDRSWRRTGRLLAGLARQAGVRQLLTLGAYPAPVPHTRPCRAIATASSRQLADRIGYLPGQMTVPAGFSSALERIFADEGLVAAGLWAQVPHYVANVPYPAAALALIEQLEALTGIVVGRGELAQMAVDGAAHIDRLVAANPEHAEMVAQLERTHDAQTPTAPTPLTMHDGDQLAEEVERFLRERDR